ncbi:MAG: ABC transporter permease, partial [Gemmatimonadaceae bacterium]
MSHSYWQRGARTISSVAAYMSGYGVSLSGDGEPARLTSALVTSSFFDVLGIAPRAGQFFRAGDDALSAEPTVVISHSLWRDRFSGDVAILGKRIDIDGQPRTVVGVAPAGFAFPSSETRLWIPLRIDQSKLGPYWGSYGHQLIGRLTAGNTTAQARDEIRRIATDLQRENPVWHPTMPEYVDQIAVSDLQSHLVGDRQRLLYVLLGAVGLVLLLACANVANLLMVRGAARERELAIRAALGAGTRRLSRQLLAENLVLAVAGGAVGVVIAVVGLRFLTGLLPADTPRLDTVRVD